MWILDHFPTFFSWGSIAPIIQCEGYDTLSFGRCILRFLVAIKVIFKEFKLAIFCILMIPQIHTNDRFYRTFLTSSTTLVFKYVFFWLSCWGAMLICVNVLSSIKSCQNCWRVHHVAWSLTARSSSKEYHGSIMAVHKFNLTWKAKESPTFKAALLLVLGAPMLPKKIGHKRRSSFFVFRPLFPGLGSRKMI